MKFFLNYTNYNYTLSLSRLNIDYKERKIKFNTNTKKGDKFTCYITLNFCSI